jgi:hypothetical protein
MEQSAAFEQQPFSANQASQEQSEAARAKTAGEYLDKALHLLGASMRTAASLVKERSPREGVARNALQSASKVLDKTADYMLGERPSENIGGIIKKYPLRSVGVCFLGGLVAGSVLRAVRR